MKSAWELALERTGGALNEISEEKKTDLAEIDRIYKAKLAEAELSNRRRLGKASKLEEIEQINQDFATETASISSKMEREKDKIRNA